MKRKASKAKISTAVDLLQFGMNEAFPRRAYMSRAAVSGNAYEVTFRRIKVPDGLLTIIVIALNLEEAACKLRETYKDDFSDFVEIKSLGLRAIG